MATIEMQTIPTINLGVGGGVASIQPTFGVGPQGLPGPGSAAWTAGQVVTTGSVRQAPDGSWIKATANRTTGATFDATEQTFWRTVSATTATLEKVALDATYARGVNVTDPQFGAKGDGVTNDRAAIQAAIDYVTARGGGAVFFPPTLNFYAVFTSLTLPTFGITFYGLNSESAAIRMVGAFPLFAPTVEIRNFTFEGLSLQSVGGHIFELGTTGGLSMSTFRNCSFIAYANPVSIFHQNGPGSFLGLFFYNCDWIRFGTATVPLIDVRNTGGAANSNSWKGCRVNSNNATGGGPAFKMRADAVGTYLDHNVFQSLWGELNQGGLIEMDSPSFVTFDDVIDYDVSGSYTQSLIKIGKAAGGFPLGVKLSGVGNRGGTINNTTVFQLQVTAGTGTPVVMDRVCDSLGRTYVSFSGQYGATELNASGASPVLSSSTVTKNIDASAEGIIVFNGASLTAHLPDPTTLRPGRAFIIKNVNATALTVDSLGTSKTIDGAATKSLAQWATGQYATDGTQWLTV